ncbi:MULTISPECIES: hypothetical protein [unclassified Bradyrhizobium]|uniref:hypothetical protein n=1 Tax=Bradyrhizobium sp. USDA 4541 TaxID=2817704 RepID=UPI0020A41E15|nr:hypothetical protein [Bradyrhizobium sp. USDA 4541]MCP1846781.1 hypothetical protein [Bradyrhizobium sp. USDA 4541]
MKRRATILSTAALLCLAVAVPMDDAFAQQTQRVSYKAGAENAKYTQQQFLDVGDVAGHQVRSFEIYRTFSTNPPVVNGLKIKETWTRGVSDYVDNNGPASIYNVYGSRTATSSSPAVLCSLIVRGRENLATRLSRISRAARERWLISGELREPLATPIPKQG